jgi:hypothetical protein
VKVIRVDEHVWRHTRRGDKNVTVVIDLTQCGWGFRNLTNYVAKSLLETGGFRPVGHGQIR